MFAAKPMLDTSPPHAAYLRFRGTRSRRLGPREGGVAPAPAGATARAPRPDAALQALDPRRGMDAAQPAARDGSAGARLFARLSLQLTRYRVRGLPVVRRRRGEPVPERDHCDGGVARRECRGPLAPARSGRGLLDSSRAAGLRNLRD